MSIAGMRRWQTEREVQRLTAVTAEWASRADTPSYQRYAAHMDAVRGEIIGAAAMISAEIARAGSDIFDVYATCSRCDRAIAWLWRLLTFFRNKFDQRDDARLNEYLFAADEVVLSCFSAFTMRAGEDRRRLSPPLPFFDGDYSPASIRADQSPASLVDPGASFDFLRGYLESMPVSLLRLPITSVGSPWMLVLIGHEVGHFVQASVAPDLSYLTKFAATVETIAADAAGGSVAANWKRWSPEIFADLYSVFMMGPWALWTMGQFELTDAEGMTTTRGRELYPSRCLRLELLRQLIDRLFPEAERAGTRVLTDFGIDLTRLLEAIPQPERNVPALLAEHLIVHEIDGIGVLRDVTGFEAADFTTTNPDALVPRLAKMLLGETGAFELPRQRRSARLIAAATARAWVRLDAIDEEARQSAAERVTKRALAAIKATAEPVRAATKVAASASPAGAGGSELGTLLLRHDIPAPGAPL